MINLLKNQQVRACFHKLEGGVRPLVPILDGSGRRISNTVDCRSNGMFSKNT